MAVAALRATISPEGWEALKAPAKEWQRPPYHELLKDAFQNWKGDSLTIHGPMANAIANEPYPGSGSGKQMRARTEVLMHELSTNHKRFNRTLYRGSSMDHHPEPGEEVNLRPSSFSSNSRTSKKFIDRNEPSRPSTPQRTPVMYIVNKGSRGLKVRDYIHSGLDDSEQEHILGGKFRVDHVDPQEHGLHVHLTHVEPFHWEGDMNRTSAEKPRQPFFHGTNVKMKPGDIISPGHGQTFDPPNQHYSPHHVYFTGYHSSAESFAWSRAHKHGGEQHVYQVEPEGEFEPDPETAHMPGYADYRAKRLRVLKEAAKGDELGPHLDAIHEIAQEHEPDWGENYEGRLHNWCYHGSRAVTKYLKEQGIKAKNQRGGFRGNAHAWVQLPDRTIVDPTIQQYIDRTDQHDVDDDEVPWRPHKDDDYRVAVIPPDHPLHREYTTKPDTYEATEKTSAKEVTHAGLALMAQDTGRVLTLQRALDEKDPAGGKWEMPGGSLEEGESPVEGAIREWKEETGCQLPPGEVADSWLSGGMYRGFVYVVPSEDVLDINGSPEDRQVLNPDGDPDGDNPEVVAWWSVNDLKKNEAVRKEFRNGTDWSVFSKAMKKAAAYRLYRGERPYDDESVRVYGDMTGRFFTGDKDMALGYARNGGHLYHVDAPDKYQYTHAGEGVLPKALADQKVHDEDCPTCRMDKTSAEKPPCECGHPQSEHSRGRGTCDSCWGHFMEHFQDWYKGTGPEVTYCKRYKGDRSKTAAADDWASRVKVRDGHLENPEDGSLVWHHGSPANWEKEPEEDDDEGDWDGEPENKHWNTYLGTHWTSHPKVAEQFAKGMYDKERSAKEVAADPGHVYTAHLGIKNPKVYHSEYDLDLDAVHHYDKDVSDREVLSSEGKPGIKQWIHDTGEDEHVAGYLKHHLQSQGHDGIVYGNEMEGPHRHPCAITFDEGQHHNVQRRWANQPPTEQQRLFEAKLVSNYGHIVLAMSDSKTAVYQSRVVVPPQPHLHGHEITELRQPSGSPVRGKPIDAEDPSIPDHVYHVTTHMPAVRESGYLRAGGQGGLGGDANDQIVSMTTDPEVAHNLEHDIKFMAGMHQKHGPDTKANFNHETKQWEGGDPERGKRIFDDFNEEGKRTGTEIPENYDSPHIHGTYGLRDYATVFYGARSSQTRREGRHLRNPIFFGDLSHVNPDHVGTVKIPKKNLAGSGSLITDFDRDNPHGLSEVRAYGDVPLEGAKFGQEKAKVASSLPVSTPEEWRSKLRVHEGHLENPEDGSLSWHHGTPAQWGKEPEDEDEGYGDYEEPERHWNTHLGTHWTSHPKVAEQFARGLYGQERTSHEAREDPGQVYTAHLGIKNPKVYRSELDMDKEAYDHAWKDEDPEAPHEPESSMDYPEGVKERYDTPGDRAHWLSTHPESEPIASKFKRHLQSQGHDGVVYGNNIEGPHLHPCAITFDDAQHHNVRRRRANEQEHHPLPDPNQQRLFEAMVTTEFGHIVVAMSDRSDYGMGHSPNEDGPPLHNLTEEGNYTPSDFYENMHQYGTGADQADAESMSAIRAARGDKPLHKRPAVDNAHWRERGMDFEDHPEETDEQFSQRQEQRRNGEHHVTVYRAAPKGVKSLNHGDWVSLSPTYARDEGRVTSDKSEDYPVYKARVKAKHVRWPADSINEFGYFGPEAKTNVHYRGGKNAERVGPSPKEGSMKVSLASDEIVVPRNIDTLRDSTCAVCGSVGTMNGDRCTVCGYMATPTAFQDPDLSLAPKVRDELGIGNPEGDDAIGAPDAGLEGPPGAEGDLDAMGEGGEGPQGPVGAEGDLDDLDASDETEAAPSLVCDNCGATFDSDEQEEDLSEPYLSPASRVEPDVSALGVDDDMEVAREVAQEENMTGANEGVAHQEGDECPVCGVGELVLNDNPELGEEGLGGEEGIPGEEEEGLPGEEEGLPGEEVPPGQEAAPGEEEGPDGGEEAPPQAEGEEEAEGLPPGEQGPPIEGDEDEEPEDDDEDDQEDEDDGPPFGRRQRKESSTMATGAPRRQAPVPPRRQAPPPRPATAAAPNPAALERRRLFQALEATTASLNRQADLLQAQDRKLNSVGKFMRQAGVKLSELGLRNETLERQMALVANASGLVEPLATIGAAGQNRVAALYGRTANPANPAQPVPEPSSEPPTVTSQEAVQSAGRDDVTQLGASPVSDVAADAVTSVDVPYGELANQPVGMNRTDVTAPVQGTETATPPEMTVIPVDTRIGNPDDPQVAFPFTVGPVGAPGRPYSGPSVGNPPSTAARNGQRPEPGVAVHPQAQAHYIAAVNLARLRAQVGISAEEPFELGSKIAASMSDAQINAEAQGLQAVAHRLTHQASGPAPFQPGPAFAPVAANGERPVMVPHLASAPGNSVLPTDPSFQAGKYGAGPGAAIQATTMFAPRADEFGWDSPV